MEETISYEVYEEMLDDDCGLCTSCGEESTNIEPDARGYECEHCGQNHVYGAESLLEMGWVE